MSETSEMIITLFCIIILAILVIIGIRYVDETACRKRAVITETEYRFDWLVGCYYKEGDKWVKHNEENSEAQKVYVKGVSK